MPRILAFVMAASAVADNKLPPPANIKVDFEKHIQPLLQEKCVSCHGRQVQQSGLRLDSRQPAMRGGVYGPVILPGNSAESKFIRRLVGGDGGLQMPPTGALSSDEIGLFRAWIDQGADFRISIQPEPPAKPVTPEVAAFITVARSSDIARAASTIKQKPEIVKATDHAGSTPLHHAAGFGSLGMLKLLLEAGADPNALNGRKSPPLFWGIYDEARVRHLIEGGADVNARTVDGLTPVYQAASLGNGTAILRLLLKKGGKADVKTITGSTPLMAAARRGDTESMRLLIDAGANVHALDAAGANALMAAASSGNSSAVALLLDQGADPNVTTKRKATALADAASAGNEESVRLLLARGAKVDVQDDRGYTALLYAAGSDTLPAGVVKTLLDKGADRGLKGDGETAMALAAKRGNTEVAKLLGAPRIENAAAAPGVELVGTGAQSRKIPEAVTAGLRLLEKQSHEFIRVGGCNSCHAQDLPSAAAAVARSHGIPAPAAIPQLPPHMNINTPERLMDLVTVGISGVGVTWELFDSGMNNLPADRYTDAVVRYLKAIQSADGSWLGQRGRRPPMISGKIQATALAVYSLMRYGPPAEHDDTRRAIRLASKWLEGSRAQNTQDRAFRLLGLSWANASTPVLSSAAKELAETQREDGGWSQLSTMTSDAYATGQALYALHVAGKLPSGDARYQRGVRYLLRTQAADGSWWVKSRSIWLQPYFESGFPYGHDQWISAAGTAWASMALSVAVEPEKELRQASR
ncbi:MAG TPA: ankyrin repeat domain-containing protein [Bryobacteraceae bacterium]|nr:ankyrin repeat domain-containing protein [Bryobacteraceae bacterium]